MNIIESTISFVKKELKDAEGGHDWWHVYRVWSIAKKIAQKENADQVVVELAALLHDIGHYKNEIPETSLAKGVDNFHEEAGANFLEDYFPLSVVEPIRQHVAAKRYLCAVKSDYFERLSAASIHTLNLQGGAMNEEEVKEFEKNVYLEQCINLRYWDEDAKDPERVHPAFSYYRSLVESLVNY